MFRIGHLGDCNDLTLMATLAGVEMGLKLAGVKLAGSGVAGRDGPLRRPPRAAAPEGRGLNPDHHDHRRPHHDHPPQLHRHPAERRARPGLAGLALPAVAQMELKLGHVGGPGSLFELSANEFARRANEKLGNKAKVVVFGSSQLGGDAN